MHFTGRKQQWLESTSGESGRRKCQSRAASEHEEEEEIMTTEELHSFNADNKEGEIEILYILVQSSILMENAAKKSEGWE